MQLDSSSPGITDRSSDKSTSPGKSEKLDASLFVPEWQRYKYDITYLAHSHQVGSTVATTFDQRFINQCQLAEERLEGSLKFLMRVADVSDNSQSGDHTSRHETHI